MGKRKKQAVLGFISDMGGQAVLTVATLLATPIILTYTSKSLYGFWVTALSLISYFGLVDMGFSISLTHRIASLFGRVKASEINRAISTAFFSFCLMGAIFLCIGLCVGRFIPVWFKIPSSEILETSSTYNILILTGALALPLSIFSAVIAGVQRMAVGNMIRNITSLFGIVLSVFLLYKGVGLLALAISRIVALGLQGFASYLFCKQRYCTDLKVSPFLINREDFVKLWAFGKYFQIGRIANMIAINTDAILIAALLGTSMVTPYALTSKLALLISVAVASKIPSALFPALSQMFAHKEMSKLRQAFFTLAYYSTRLAIVGGVFLIIVNRKFVSLWVGPEFFGGTALNIVFVLWVLVDTIFRGTGVILQASGDLKDWSKASIAEAVLNISISLILVKPFGLVGIALGTLISRILTTGIFVPIWACNMLQLSMRVFILKGIVNPMLRSLPSVCVVILFAVLTRQMSGWIWILAVGLVVIAGNVFSFEYTQLAKIANEPLRNRFRRMFNVKLISGDE